MVDDSSLSLPLLLDLLLLFRDVLDPLVVLEDDEDDVEEELLLFLSMLLTLCVLLF